MSTSETTSKSTCNQIMIIMILKNKQTKTNDGAQVFSLFLDALTLLIETHKDDLHENLYFLMSRLLNKLGADLLGSVQAKTLKTLDLVR